MPPSGARTDAVRVLVRITPRAGADALAGWRDGRLLIRTTAPPVQGRANAAVRALLAEVLGVAAGKVQVVRGAQSREKLVQITGLPAPEVLRRLRHPDYS